MKKSVFSPEDLELFKPRPSTTKPKSAIFSNARRAAMISNKSLHGENSVAGRCVKNAAKELETQSSTNKIWPRQADCSSFSEYYDKYAEIVVGSEGFISYPDPTSTIMGGIGTCPVNDTYTEKAAKYAVEAHNEKTGANITLKKIVKANSQFGKGLEFYLTLETLDGDQTVFKEAKVHQYIGGSHKLDIFRDAIYYYKIKEVESKLALESSLEGNADSSTKRSTGRSQKRAFFDAHKHENWLKIRYHPTNLLEVFGRRKVHTQMTASNFVSNLTSGIVDLSPTAFCSRKSWQTGEPNSNDKAADGGGKHEFSAAPKAHPVSCLPIRIHRDIGLASALVRKLDIEKGIKDNVLCNINYYREFNRGSMFQVLVVKCLPTERVLYGTELLDTLLTYLWRIHGVNYYGMIESDYPEGFRHVRPDGKDHGETSESGDEWLCKLQSFWYKRLADPWEPISIRKRGLIRKQFKRMRSKLLTHPWKPMIMKQKLDAATIEAFYRYKCVKKIYDEKHGWMCGCVADGCTELFYCAEHAHEHLKLKHPEVEMKLTSLLHEKVYLHNYMSDPDARGGSWWDP